MHYRRSYLTLIILLLILIGLWVLNISLGTVHIPFREVLKILFGQEVSTSSWETIVLELRLPRSVTAIVVGAGLSLAGLLMQTYFRNPMAGPSVLGISSGASLGVALFLMGSGVFGFHFIHKIGLVLSAVIGALAVLLLIVVLSLRLKNNLSILIIGLMLGALTSSIVGVLSYFSTSEQIRTYVLWNLGSLGHVNWPGIWLMVLLVIVAFGLIFLKAKALNTLLLGETFAKSVGVSTEQLTYIILAITGIIVGVITAYVGPIAFVGLAVPHIARLVLKTSDHKILLPAVLLLGSIVLLFCDLLAQLPFYERVIPINSVTSLIGAPIVIYLILKQRHYDF